MTNAIEQPESDRHHTNLLGYIHSRMDHIAQAHACGTGRSCQAPYPSAASSAPIIIQKSEMLKTMALNRFHLTPKLR